MAYYNKIGLLVLSEDAKKFLVCEPGEKYTEKSVTQYLMPGGKLEEKSDVECLQREIKEELDCELNLDSLELIGEYTDVAATPGRDVMIRLYKGKLIGIPTPSTEIGALHWIGKEDVTNQKVSPIIRNKIIPDLVEKGIVK
ncbi:MAG: NUDIX domain-containing protein [Patescibacteria group bacterium]